MFVAVGVVMASITLAFSSLRVTSKLRSWAEKLYRGLCTCEPHRRKKRGQAGNGEQRERGERRRENRRRDQAGEHVAGEHVARHVAPEPIPTGTRHAADNRGTGQDAEQRMTANPVINVNVNGSPQRGRGNRGRGGRSRGGVDDDGDGGTAASASLSSRRPRGLRRGRNGGRRSPRRRQYLDHDSGSDRSSNGGESDNSRPNAGPRAHGAHAVATAAAVAPPTAAAPLAAAAAPAAAPAATAARRGSRRTSSASSSRPSAGSRRVSFPDATDLAGLPAATLAPGSATGPESEYTRSEVEASRIRAPRPASDSKGPDDEEVLARLRLAAIVNEGRDRDVMSESSEGGMSAFGRALGRGLDMALGMRQLREAREADGGGGLWPPGEQPPPVHQPPRPARRGRGRRGRLSPRPPTPPLPPSRDEAAAPSRPAAAAAAAAAPDSDAGSDARRRSRHRRVAPTN